RRRSRSHSSGIRFAPQKIAADRAICRTFLQSPVPRAAGRSTRYPYRICASLFVLRLVTFSLRSAIMYAIINPEISTAPGRKHI
ncbi:hypothetical protein, partial [Bradyrhizobium ivorense]|uniref:hypothetical protein n=1 Tax=Bradyrhizobium ivorense TaxID=2511166 RepID=UPI001E45EC48